MDGQRSRQVSHKYGIPERGQRGFLYVFIDKQRLQSKTTRGSDFGHRLFAPASPSRMAFWGCFTRSWSSSSDIPLSSKLRAIGSTNCSKGSFTLCRLCNGRELYQDYLF